MASGVEVPGERNVDIIFEVNQIAEGILVFVLKPKLFYLK